MMNYLMLLYCSRVTFQLNMYKVRVNICFKKNDSGL